MADTQQISDNTAAQQELGQGQGVSVGPGITLGFTTTQNKSKTKEVTFQRTYTHFLGPGTEMQGAMIESNDDNKLCYTYDWGASYLPFCYTRAAVLPEHLYKYMFHANSIEIISHSVKMFDIICSRDELQADGRIVTTPQQDTIEIFEDHRKYFRPHNIRPIDNNGLFNINYQYKQVEPDSIEIGMLPRVKVMFPSEMYTSTKNEKLKDYKLRAFDVYNGLFQVSNIHPGSVLERTHIVNSGRIPCAAFGDMCKLPCNVNKLNLATKLMDTVFGVQANMATQQNRSPILPPHQMFLRFAPYWTATGKAQRRAQMKVTYSCTMRFHYSPHAGVNMFMLGNQPEKLNFPYDDVYDNAQADILRFNFGCHAEDFVMPMTGYFFTEANKQENFDFTKDPIADLRKKKGKELKKTLQSKTESALIDVGYEVKQPVLQDNSAPEVQITTAAQQPVEGQKPPQHSDAVLKDAGLTDEQIADIDIEMETPSVSGETAYKIVKTDDTNLIVDSAKDPVLPVQVDIRSYLDKPKITNVPAALRPAQLWKKMGVDNPPVYTSGQKPFIPWPKMAPDIANVVGRNLAYVNDMDALIKLNKSKIDSLIRTRNRLKKRYPVDEPKIIKQEKSAIASDVATIPMRVMGEKIGPKFPLPASEITVPTELIESLFSPDFVSTPQNSPPRKKQKPDPGTST